ncbi:HD domain-containing protein, partial [Thermoproteota archaeon]
MNEYIKIIENKIHGIIDKNLDQSIAHKWDHLNRVRNRALYIARNIQNVDLEVLEIASLLHDIDEKHYHKKNHAQMSVEKASKILNEIKYSKL